MAIGAGMTRYPLVHYPFVMASIITDISKRYWFLHIHQRSLV
jgi:hypothetical protein